MNYLPIRNLTYFKNLISIFKFLPPDQTHHSPFKTSETLSNLNTRAALSIALQTLYLNQKSDQTLEFLFKQLTYFNNLA